MANKHEKNISNPSSGKDQLKLKWASRTPNPPKPKFEREELSSAGQDTVPLEFSYPAGGEQIGKRTLWRLAYVLNVNLCVTWDPAILLPDEYIQHK